MLHFKIKHLHKFSTLCQWRGKTWSHGSE